MCVSLSLPPVGEELVASYSRSPATQEGDNSDRTSRQNATEPENYSSLGIDSAVRTQASLHPAFHHHHHLDPLPVFHSVGTEPLEIVHAEKLNRCFTYVVSGVVGVFFIFIFI